LLILKNKDMNTNKLKGLMKEKGYTYAIFIEMIGISMTALQNCLKKGKTDTQTLLKMCDVLNVTPNDLLL